MLLHLVSELARSLKFSQSGFRRRGGRRLLCPLLAPRVESTEVRCLLSGAAPVVVSITPLAPPPSVDQIEFEVRFSEPVTGVSVSNFSIVQGNNSSYVDSVSGGQEVWKVKLAGLSYIGTIGVRFTDPDSQVRDTDGNPVYDADERDRAVFRDDVDSSFLGDRAGVVLGDFNADGRGDVASLITSDQLEQSAVRFLYGRQDGAFSTGGAALTGGGTPLWVRQAKLDQDIYPDVAVGFWQPGSVGSVQLIDVGPSGSTAGSTLLALQESESVERLYFQDLNGDGLSEIVTLVEATDLADQSRFQVRVRWNNGTGGYSQITESAPLNGLLVTGLRELELENSVRFLNVTGDASPEILLLPPWAHSVYVLQVQQVSGSPALQTVATYQLGDSGAEVFATVADLNGDGRFDIIHGDVNPDPADDSDSVSTLFVRIGRAAGLFAEPEPLLQPSGEPLSINIEPYGAALRVGDVNQDGINDVFYVNERLTVVDDLGNFYSSVDLRWLRGQANGRFSDNVLESIEYAAVGTDQWFWDRPATAVMGPGLDFFGSATEGEGFNGLIGRVKFAAEPSVLTEIRESTFVEAVYYSDFNGDGVSDDLLQGRKYFSVLPEGTWAEEYEFLEVSGETPRLLESGDASGVAFGRIPGLTGSTQDSRLVVADAGSSSVRLYRGAGYGLPQGLLNQQVTAEYAVTGPPADLLLHDLDGNGTLDLATANSSASGAVSILLGSGGVFNPAAGINLPAGSSALTVGDVNQDGFPDLLVAGNDGVVRLLRGNGNGSFQSPVDTVQSASISGLYVADMNGDGRVDLFVESQSAGRVTVYQGNGNGSFTARGDIQPAGGVRSSRLADVNRDGLTDLVIGTSTGKINLYLGKEVSVIDHMDLQWVLIELPSGDAVRDLQVADLTGDDRPEITVLQTVLKAGHFSSLLVVCSPPAVADGTWNVRSEERGDFQYLFIDELGVDGRPDLLMADRSGGNFFWYLNDNLPYETSQQAPYNANRFPTLDVIAPVRMPEDAAAISVPLTGISAGGFENQKLRVTAVSSQTTLLDNPQVVYTDFSTTGQLRLQPVPLATGVVQVTVTVDDAGFDNDFNTLVDNRSFSRSFEVTIVPQRPVVTVPAAPVKAPFTVTWTAVPDAVSYRVFVRNYSLGQNPIVTAETTQTSWTSAADLAMGRCEVWVQAVAAGGKRLPWSLGRRFTVATPPVTAAVPARLADPSHEFSWTAVPGASEYRVWVTFVSGGANPLVQQKVTGLKWRPSEPLPLGRHTFWVQAIAPDATTSAWSAPVNFLVATAPRQVAPLASVFDTTPVFRWDSVAGAASYGVYLQDMQTGAVVANISGISGLSWEPTQPLEARDYRWWVIGETSFNGLRGNWSPAVKFYVGGRAEITAPLQSAFTGPTPIVSWKRIEDAVSYRVWITQITPVNRVALNIGGLTGTSYQVPQALTSGGHRVWVQAVTADGIIGPWSLPVNFTVPSLTETNTTPAPLVTELALLGRSTVPAIDLQNSLRVVETKSAVLNSRGTAAPVTPVPDTVQAERNVAELERLPADALTPDLLQQVLDTLLLAAPAESV